ncbi:MAG: M1 family aminopeptidase [Proteobacteria bacterium]|nr:M1 family aminopeptidase [Pseudomonadota bacterium]
MATCRCRRDAPNHSFGGELPTPHYPPNLEIEPVHLDISLSLAIEAETAKVLVRTTVVARKAGTKTLVLDGIDFLGLVVVAEVDAPHLTYDGKKIVLTWARPFAHGEQRSVALSYRVEHPISGMFFKAPSAADPAKPLAVATDHETELARYWLACIDQPNVRTTLAFHITAAESLSILANGRLESEEVHGDGTKTAHWRLDQRCPSYLVCFAVGDFTRFDDGTFDTLEVAYFGCRDFSPQDLELSFGRTKAMLSWITRRLGVPFPFPKYYQFALPDYGGAMENISLVSWNDDLVCDQRSIAEGGWLTDQVNIHEMAHSYFGDLVVCRDFAHAWLKESWATYMETCWLEDSKGSDEQLYDLYSNAQRYIEEVQDSYARPLVTRTFTSSWQMYDRHLYPGGGCRLHTLRHEIGDVLFWQAVTEYLQTFRDQVVETHDFQRMLEKHAGRSLQKLFDQWIYTASYPQLKVAFSYDAERHVGSFTIEQKQVDEKARIPAFELNTEIAWTIGGEDFSQKIALTEARHTFQVAMSQDPEQVRFDPSWKVLHSLDFDPGSAKLKEQLSKAKDVPGRIHAAQQLVKTGKRADLRAVQAAYGGETFWGVRCEMIKALASSKSEEGIAALVGIIASEEDPLVLPTVFSQAGLLRDERIQAALVQRHARGGLGPKAQASLYSALGKQRDRAPLDLLQAAAKITHPRHGVEQATALAALGQTRRPEVVPQLLAATAPGETPYRARGGALRGLAAIAPYVERGLQAQIIERCVDLLRDPEASVRKEAAKALSAARATGEIAALEAYRLRVPLQEQVAIDPLLKGLRSSAATPLKALEEQVNTLQTKLRALNERLQDLEDKGR